MNPKGKPDNLKPFGPGKSGNPGGRPRKRPISGRYADVAETELPDDFQRVLRLPKGATFGDAIAMGQVRAAIKGRTDAAREVREAIEGKATQRIEIADTTIADAFEKMKEAELDAYAKDGTLPDWFPKSGDDGNGG
jgi:hypothetical protein